MLAAIHLIRNRNDENAFLKRIPAINFTVALKVLGNNPYSFDIDFCFKLKVPLLGIEFPDVSAPSFRTHRRCINN